MSRKLTFKQKLFIKEYCKDGNATRAVRVSYPNIKTEEGRAVMGTNLLRNNKVQDAIEKALERRGITPDLVMEKFQTIAENAKYDRDKISAWRNISEMAGFMKKEPQVFVGQNQNVDVNDILEHLRNPVPIEVTKPEQINPTQTEKDLQAYNNDKQQTDLSS